MEDSPRSHRPTEPSHPPSEPRPRAGAWSDRGAERTGGLRPISGDEGDDRPVRAQMIALIVLGFVLVAVPLYLWRRPRAIPETSAEPAATEIPIAAMEAGATTVPDAGVTLVKLSEPSVLECHDPGPKKTAPDQCGHLPLFEKAFARAIEGAASCVPSTSRPSSLVWVADVSYARRSHVQLMKSEKKKTVKGAGACESQIEHALKTAELDPDHAHQRYKIQISASYP